MDRKSKLIYAICQVLLIHDGPINEFTLSLCLSRKHVKIDPILTYLPRKTRVKKLKFNFGWPLHCVPLSHYSFGHLTDLYLIRCGFHLPPTFNGFGSLTSLYLQEVNFSTVTLQHLLSNCPLLKTLDIRNPCISGSIGGPTISEIFECLPVIETFSISFELIRVFRDIAIHKVPRELSTTLIHLKYLRIDGVYFFSKTELSVLALLIKSSPNLEKLKARVWDHSNLEMSKRRDYFRVEDYSDIMLERLNELEITSFINAKNQLDFVRLLGQITCAEEGEDIPILYNSLSIFAQYWKPGFYGYVFPEFLSDAIRIHKIVVKTLIHTNRDQLRSVKGLQRLDDQEQK
ncbi:F-box/FBD/LRR-repeat protein-like protein [Tanacetum coccineum]